MADMERKEKRNKAGIAGIFCGIVLLGTAMLLGACGKENAGHAEMGSGQTDSGQTAESESAEEVLARLLSDCDFLTAEMYERATAFSEGDITRIAAAMRKAEAGEKVTVGVIGGSITQGSLASGQDSCYASLLKKWWEQTFPEAEIELVNAGIGGTTSYLGVHRVEEDLLIHEPDFVVVEFSVNDANTPFYKKSYDNLIYRILQEENAPAVLLLFMTMEDGTSAQENDSLLGFQYGLPMVSYRNAVLDEINAGHFTWKDISPDNIHPNDRGHAIVGELLSAYLGSIYERLEEIPLEKAPFEKEIFTKEVYQNAGIFNRENLEPTAWGSFAAEDVSDRFAGNWTTKTGEESIFFSVEAANIGVMYQKFTDGTGGQYEVYIDGTYAMTLDADFTGGWGNYGETTEVYTSKEKALHQIEIRKKEGSLGDAFSILGLLIS